MIGDDGIEPSEVNKMIKILLRISNWIKQKEELLGLKLSLLE